MKRKTIALIGKGLIIASLLWPIPFGFVIYIPCLYPIFSWGHTGEWDWWGYWWPLLIIMAIGFVMCLKARYKAPNAAEISQIPLKETLGAKILIIIGWCLVGTIGFMLLVLFVIGCYYTFFTEYMFIITPILISTLFVGYLIYLGWTHYNNSKRKN